MFPNLAYSEYVLAVLNTSPKNQTVDISLEEAFVEKGEAFGLGTFTLYDLWQTNDDGKWGKNIGDYSGDVHVSVGRHQTRVFKAIPVDSMAKKAQYEL